MVDKIAPLEGVGGTGHVEPPHAVRHIVDHRQRLVVVRFESVRPTPSAWGRSGGAGPPWQRSERPAAAIRSPANAACASERVMPTASTP